MKTRKTKLRCHAPKNIMLLRFAKTHAHLLPVELHAPRARVEHLFEALLVPRIPSAGPKPTSRRTVFAPIPPSSRLSLLRMISAHGKECAVRSGPAGSSFTPTTRNGIAILFASAGPVPLSQSPLYFALLTRIISKKARRNWSCFLPHAVYQAVEMVWSVCVLAVIVPISVGCIDACILDIHRLTHDAGREGLEVGRSRTELRRCGKVIPGFSSTMRTLRLSCCAPLCSTETQMNGAGLCLYLGL
ncbi:hypothetical protein HDK90DRAFT_160116 [Phyllosticta capitalensis]|uniref:Uncharacterized protein n=1 Tax=Phyllosticta capitalensis TaxID=121624 RepID=A0ABR1Z157_9PEZI